MPSASMRYHALVISLGLVECVRNVFSSLFTIECFCGAEPSWREPDDPVAGRRRREGVGHGMRNIGRVGGRRLEPRMARITRIELTLVREIRGLKLLSLR